MGWADRRMERVQEDSIHSFTRSSFQPCCVSLTSLSNPWLSGAGNKTSRADIDTLLRPSLPVFDHANTLFIVPTNNPKEERNDRRWNLITYLALLCTFGPLETGKMDWQMRMDRMSLNEKKSWTKKRWKIAVWINSKKRQKEDFDVSFCLFFPLNSSISMLFAASGYPWSFHLKFRQCHSYSRFRSFFFCFTTLLTHDSR